MVHFLGHYFDPAPFWCVMGILGSCLVSLVFSLIQDRRATVASVRHMRANAELLSRATGKRLYLDGIPDAEDPKLKRLTAQGLAAMRKHRWDSAVACFHKALGHAEGTKQAFVLRNLIGVCYHVQGKWQQALVNYEETARLAEQFGDKLGKAAALGNIGLVMQDRGEPDKALVEFHAVLKMSREMDWPESVAIALGNIGVSHQVKRELDRALKYHEEALGTYRSIKDRQGEASQLCNIGLCFRDKGELDKGLKYLEDALATDREVGYQRGVAVDLCDIGNTLVLKGEHERAVDPLVTALGMHLQLGIADGPRQCRLGLWECLRTRGQQRFVAACVKAGMSKAEADKLAKQLKTSAGD